MNYNRGMTFLLSVEHFVCSVKGQLQKIAKDCQRLKSVKNPLKSSEEF